MEETCPSLHPPSHPEFADSCCGHPAPGLRSGKGELELSDGLAAGEPGMPGSGLFPPPPSSSEGTRGVRAEKKQGNHFRNSISGDAHKRQSTPDKKQGPVSTPNLNVISMQLRISTRGTGNKAGDRRERMRITMREKQASGRPTQARRGKGRHLRMSPDPGARPHLFRNGIDQEDEAGNSIPGPQTHSCIDTEEEKTRHVQGTQVVLSSYSRDAREKREVRQVRSAGPRLRWLYPTSPLGHGPQSPFILGLTV